ncbi:glycosyltransferase, partial [Methylocapsa acidiphila]|uniref:glycosyltransferase n=1 Tax=Methylocapsa acidiphila TaxID=133552 RepID=UPI00040EB36C
MTVFVDFTHLHRPITGLERIALELFSRSALAPLETIHVTAASIAGMASKQWLGLPWTALTNPGSVVLCPGFPPSIALQMACRRVIPYVHDLFAIERPQILDRAALFYTRPSLARLLRKQEVFLANSEKTRAELMTRAQKPARVELYRPRIRNIFDLHPGPSPPPRPILRFVALGTVEPRKNYLYAADVIEALNARGQPAELLIIGQAGWGRDRQALSGRRQVKLCGYLTDSEIRQAVQESDALISTALDEGLGLPLLELQYAGLPTVAVDIPIFRETLRRWAVYVPPDDACAAADAILQNFGSDGWRAAGRIAANRILEAYNRAADQDRETVIALIQDLERA